MTAPLRVGVWCAVSTIEQAKDDKVSLQEQESAGRAFAQRIGGEVVAVYRTAHSRDLIFYLEAEREMDSYRRLHEDVTAGRLDLLWAFDEDRLGRDPALGQALISLVEKNGAEVYVSTSPHVIGSKSAGHRYLHAMKITRAGEDQALRVHRYRMGMKGRVGKRGLIPGRAPLGYEAMKNGVGKTVNYRFDDQIEAVRQLTGLFLAGHSYGEITRRMNRSAHPAPSGGRWAYSTVYYILNNDVYAGLPSWGAVQYDGDPHYPVLWDDETFAAVLRQRGQRQRGPVTRTTGGPLAGVCFCARCRGRMIRLVVKPHYVYLRCATHHRYHIDRRACHRNSLREQIVIDALGAYLTAYATPERVDAALDVVSRRSQDDQLHNDLAHSKHHLADLQRRRMRLVEALESGDLDGAMYRQRDDVLLSRIEAAQSDIVTAERQLDALPDLDAIRQQLVALGAFFPELVELHQDEPQVVARALQAAGVKVWIECGQVVDIEPRLL